MDLEKRKRPIGDYYLPPQFDTDLMQRDLEKIRQFPTLLNKVVSNLTEQDLKKCYRPGSWSVFQLIHHIADSHINAFIRTKLAISEPNPTIKPYLENAWTLQEDVQLDFVESSIQIIEGLHARWHALMQSFRENDWKKTYYHPELEKNVALYEMLAMYAWHGEHHLAQIKIALAEVEN